jgi:hypothetical protein
MRTAARRSNLGPEYEVGVKTPTRNQLEVSRSTAKRKVVRAGRRGGKTTGAAIIAVEQFLEGRRILYAVPVADQLEAFWSEVSNSLADVIAAGVFYKNETEHVIEKLGTKQRIRGKTAWDADTLRGDYCDTLILDEYQLMSESAWSRVGAPMLLDNNGSAIFIYTPPSLHSAGASSKAKDPMHAGKMFKKALADTRGRWEAFTWPSQANPHISREALREIADDMTELSYRQEILAEDVEEVQGALWTHKTIEDYRVDRAPLTFKRIVVGVDPTGSTTNETGIVAAGMGYDGHGYVLADRSLLGSPERWSAEVVALYWELEANTVVAEKNFGGDMVEHTIKTADRTVPVTMVSASRGKLVRAEPVAALYEKGMIHHAGRFPELEQEMCGYVPGNPSPNRMDAATWSLTDLMVMGAHESMGSIGSASIAQPIFSGFRTKVL